MDAQTLTGKRLRQADVDLVAQPPLKRASVAAGPALCVSPPGLHAWSAGGELLLQSPTEASIGSVAAYAGLAQLRPRTPRVSFCTSAKPHDGPHLLLSLFDKLVANVFSGRIGCVVPLPIVHLEPLGDAWAALPAPCPGACLAGLTRAGGAGSSEEEAPSPSKEAGPDATAGLTSDADAGVPCSPRSGCRSFPSPGSGAAFSAAHGQATSPAAAGVTTPRGLAASHLPVTVLAMLPYLKGVVPREGEWVIPEPPLMVPTATPPGAAADRRGNSGSTASAGSGVAVGSGGDLTRAAVMAPEPVSPPRALSLAVAHIFHKYARGNRLLLRGILAMVEDLEARMTAATAALVAPVVSTPTTTPTSSSGAGSADEGANGSEEVSCPAAATPSTTKADVAASPAHHTTTAAAAAAHNDAAVTATRGVALPVPKRHSGAAAVTAEGPPEAEEADENDCPAAAPAPSSAAPAAEDYDISCPVLASRLHDLAVSPAAEAAAAAYRERRRRRLVPVLAGGGGSSVQLNPSAHMFYVQQLVLLCRHAVVAYPPPPPAAFAPHVD